LQALAPAGGIDASVSEIADYALFQLDDGMLAGHRVVSAQMMAELPSASSGVVVLTNGESDRFTEGAARSLLEQLLR